MPTFPDWTAPDGCRCRLQVRDDIPGYDRWLQLAVDTSCPAHQLQVPEDGARVRLVCMGPDPDPMPDGATGTVAGSVLMGDGTAQLQVDWDDTPRSLQLVLPADVVEVLDG